MKTIVLANNKGGVGKTTCAIYLAGALMRMGLKVLFVDLDAQANSSSYYGAKTKDEITVYDLLLKQCEIDEAIQKTPRGDIIASHKRLNEISPILQLKAGANTRLKRALANISDKYDICIIDTPPEKAFFLQSGLIAAEYAIVPINSARYAVDGLSGMFDTTLEIKEEANENLEILGIILNMYDARTNLDKATVQMLDDLKSQGVPVLDGHISIDQNIKRSQNEETDLFTYRNSTAAADFLVMAEQILEKIKEDI